MGVTLTPPPPRKLAKSLILFKSLYFQRWWIPIFFFHFIDAVLWALWADIPPKHIIQKVGTSEDVRLRADKMDT